MKISADEQVAIRTVLEAGRVHGYGNMIAHLKTAWARNLIKAFGLSETSAWEIAGGEGLPSAMQDDLLEHGEWDETGVKYRRHKK